jgi:hypothetical protein
MTSFLNWVDREVWDMKEGAISYISIKEVVVVNNWRGWERIPKL